MIKNYFKIAFRILLRYRWHSLFNILGLSIGIACFVYIYLLLRHEFEYDRFHKDISQIYRVCQKGYSTESENIFAGTQQIFSDYLLENNEYVKYLARFAPNRETQISYNDNVFIDGPTQYVENDFFKIINFHFLFGNRNDCLTKPFTVVLTKKAADKYFGNENPLGKMLKIDTSYYEVTGVLAKIPENTRFKLDFYLSWPTYYANLPPNFPREGRFLHTYVKLKPGISKDLFNSTIKNIPDNIDWERKREGVTVTLFAQALKDIHLDNTYDFTWDWENSTSKSYIYILLTTGIFILLVSALNYVNLSTTKYTTRYKEVAMKKTIGASKTNLILQFLGESLILVFIAHILGMFILELGIKYLNEITQYNFNIIYTSSQLWLIIAAIIILIGVGAGSYPAFYMSSFSPTIIRSGKLYNNTKFNFKWILVIIQFTISIVLIIGTLMIQRQVNYMKNKPLGFLKEHKLIIELPGNNVNANNYKFVKNELKNNTNIEAATISSSVPGRWRYNWRLFPTGEEQSNSQMINCMQVDYDYFSIYGLEMIKGEAFDINQSDESNSGMIFNEQAIKKFGWADAEDAMTKRILSRGETVRGVMRNFHSQGLQNTINPLGIFLIGEDYRYITLQLKENADIENTISFLKSKYDELFPGKVFNYFFLDEDFDKQYKSEEKIIKLFKIFSFIGILIACIGLFGMSAFICHKREKEIGIRKVNGANILQIFILLTKDFTFIVIIAFLFALPIAYYGTTSWLSNFAYRVNFSWVLILLSGLCAWLIAMLTISFQTWRSAKKNPVESLRFE